MQHFSQVTENIDPYLYLSWLRADHERRQREQALLSAQATADEPVWVSLGPTNGAGKMGPFAFHPTIAGTLYAAAAGGGLWKTTDQGTSWKPIGDSLAMLAVLSLAVAPSDPNVLYVGTGTSGFPTSIGAGLLKSTDGGESWSLPILADANSASVNAISVHPLNSQDLLIGTKGGGFRSTDGGASWSRIIFNLGIVGDFARDPIHPEVLYASTWSGQNHLLKSTDGGTTWADKSSGLLVSTQALVVGKMKIAISPSDPSVLYLSTLIVNRFPQPDLGVAHIFKSTDGGESWKDLDSIVNNPAPSIRHYITQNPRNNTLVVSPTDSNLVIAGGLEFLKSTDGGATWGPLSSKGVNIHLDVVDLAYQGSTLYTGTDGGIWSSEDNGETVTPHNDNLITRQYYQLAIDSVNRNRMIAGSQDNGSDFHLDTGGTLWDNPIGGDGADCAINPRNPSITYATAYPPFSYFRTANAGDPNPTWKKITPPFSSGEQGANLVMDLNNPSTLYIGSYRVWQTTNDGTTWNPLPTTITDGSAWGTNGSVADIAVAPSNSSVLMVAHSALGLLRSADGGNSWRKITASGFLPANLIDVEIDPTNAKVTYLAYNEPAKPQVFISTDAGNTWTPRITGLPPFRVLVLRIDPLDAHTIYCGTDVGVYRSTDQGVTWARLGIGLPNVQVNDIRIFKDGSILRVATFGRGIWELTLHPPIVPTIADASVSGKKLFVVGQNFDQGAAILINSISQKTQNDAENSTGRLIAKKSGKKIVSGDKLQVRNSNGTLSNEFVFIRGNQ
jgi:Uncharacterized protein related to plant photosystem II stability/assembly factor